MVSAWCWLAVVALVGGVTEKPAQPPAGFVALFNGKDLTGWQGNSKVWKVEKGMIVGDAPQGLGNNEFLASTRIYRDFVLQVQFRLVGGKGNSGIQFRSARIPNHHEMIGYQADIGEGYWGCLYDESRRNRVLVHAPKTLESALRKDGWNQYWIRCMNNRVEMRLNGVMVVQYEEKDANITPSGLLALQTHSSKDPIRVEFRDIFLQELPHAEPESSGKTGFLMRARKTAEGADDAYAIFLPADYHNQPQKKWPLLVFLHGSGERGNDGHMSIKVGIGPAILARANNFPFIVLLPQAKQSWDAQGADGQRVMALVDEMKKVYRVDDNQVHLTGLSMGGAGTWSLGTTHPRTWASLAMVCGFGDEKKASTLQHLPFWGFCGDKDFPRLLDSMRKIAAEFKMLNAPAHYTEYPGVDHNSWDLAYNHDELYTWMLKQRRKDK